MLVKPFPADAGMNRYGVQQSPRVAPFPADAGMNRRGWTVWRKARAVPRGRGDEPDTILSVGSSAVPFPADAGMNRLDTFPSSSR